VAWATTTRRMWHWYWRRGPLLLRLRPRRRQLRLVLRARRQAEIGTRRWWPRRTETALGWRSRRISAIAPRMARRDRRWPFVHPAAGIATRQRWRAGGRRCWCRWLSPHSPLALVARESLRCWSG
jgi:hypothetical protein